jgi:hypothetical protein
MYANLGPGLEVDLAAPSSSGTEVLYSHEYVARRMRSRQRTRRRTYNLYEYVESSPVKYIDPLGLETFSAGPGIDLDLGFISFSLSADLNFGFGENGIFPSTISASITGAAGPGAGLYVGGGGHATVTNAPTVDALEGAGRAYQINTQGPGFAVIEGCAVGGGGAATYQGATYSLGTGLGGAAGIQNTDTISTPTGLLPWNPRAQWWFGLPNPFAD